MGVTLILTSGVCLACVTTFLSALGFTLQKASFASAPFLGCLRSPFTWYAGLACVVISALASLAVSALLGQLLASSMAALTLVWAAGARHFLLGEAVGIHDVAEAVLLMAGTVIIAAGRGLTERDPVLFSPTLLATSLNSWRSAIYCAVFFFCFAVLWTSSWRQFCRLPCLLGLSALFGALTGAASKAVGSLLVQAGRTGSIAEVAASFYTWLFVLVLVASVLFQLAYLNEALKVGAASVVIPSYQGLFLLGGVATALVLWREDEGLTPAGGGCVGAGVAIIIAGLAYKAVLDRASPATGTREPPAAPPPRHIRRSASAPAARLRAAAGAPAAAAGTSPPAAAPAATPRKRRGGPGRP
jgi:hypothetical protein